MFSHFTLQLPSLVLHVSFHLLLWRLALLLPGNKASRSLTNGCGSGIGVSPVHVATKWLRSGDSYSFDGGRWESTPHLRLDAMLDARRLDTFLQCECYDIVLHKTLVQRFKSGSVALRRVYAELK